MPTPPHGCLAVSAATFEIARRQEKWEENRNFLRQFVDPMDLVGLKTWYLTSPEGAQHTAHNLCHFVRKNPRLFAAEDVVWKRRKAEKGLGSANCKATAGLSNVRQGRTRSWKGWSLTDGKPPLRRIDWAAVDWSKSTSQISNRLGIAGVAVYRRRLGASRRSIQLSNKPPVPKSTIASSPLKENQPSKI
ncbi:hypothetical protein JIN84_21655 [Luteolibacter yonseiensis]|uniref:Uncharacterized protein n=1 Tax=Luteolibacter yonseiensis TaxID=1144680 RepID=A0A934VCD9_9BACT|nr:hypothetical protein [Luteolibacter yonseiensis]MBK1818243.1 hypothetical protein [Luteolibacter yonseiensis]